MSEKDFVLQTVDVLNLNVFSLKTKREVCHDLGLTIMQLQEIEYLDRRICLAIIGESHFFWIEGLLFELLACTELAAKQSSEMILEKFVQGYDLNQLNFALCDNGLRYSVVGKLNPYQPLEQALNIQGKELICLREEFPFCDQGKDLSCWTEVSLAEIAPKNLLLQTSHAYPPDHIVLTRSQLFFT